MGLLGKVESLWRYPVKSMRGEKLDEAFVGFAGIYGDRLYAFHSSAAPKGFPYLTGREQQTMLLCRPVFRNPERARKPANLPDAEALGSGLTPIYADFSDLMLDVETPAGERLAIDDPRLILMLREGLDGVDLTLLRSHRALTDCRPVSIISLQTAQQLSNETGIDVDKRRFRANIYAELESGKAFGEDDLVGKIVRIGERASVAVLQRDTRCKMITLNPDTAEVTPELMRRLARDHESKAGVYGAVLVEGTIHPGDEIVSLD